MNTIVTQIPNGYKSAERLNKRRTPYMTGEARGAFHDGYYDGWYGHRMAKNPEHINAYSDGYHQGYYDAFHAMPEHLKTAMNAQLAARSYANQALGFTKHAMQDYIRNHPLAFEAIRYEFREAAANAAERYKRARVAMGIEPEFDNPAEAL